MKVYLNQKFFGNVPVDFQQFLTKVINTKAATGKRRKELSGSNQSGLPWSGWMSDRILSFESVNDEWLISRLRRAIITSGSQSIIYHTSEMENLGTLQHTGNFPEL